MIQVKFTRSGPWFESSEIQAQAAFQKNYRDVTSCFADLDQGLVVVTNFGSFRKSNQPAKTPPVLEEEPSS